MIDTLIQYLNDAVDWFFGILKDFLLAVLDVVKDAFIWALDGVLQAIVAVFSAIPEPAFLAVSMGDILSGVHPMVGYFANGIGLPGAVGLLAAGFVFRMMRKVLTLFQW